MIKVKAKIGSGVPKLSELGFAMDEITELRKLNGYVRVTLDIAENDERLKQALASGWEPVRAGVGAARIKLPGVAMIVTYKGKDYTLPLRPKSPARGKDPLGPCLSEGEKALAKALGLKEEELSRLGATRLIQLVAFALQEKGTKVKVK